MHFEKTKAYLMDNIFANNHVACHTRPDYYLDSSVASKASSKLVSKIIESKGHADGEDFAKLKTAICKADGESDHIFNDGNLNMLILETGSCKSHELLIEIKRLK